MNRNTTIAILIALIFASEMPAQAASKEMIQLEEEIKLLGTQMTQMQQSFDEKLAALRADTQQTADNVKQISAWAAQVDATLKQQTADSDTCADQISGSSKALREQLEEMHANLDRIAKELHDISAGAAANGAAAPSGAAASPSGAPTQPPPEKPEH